MLQGPKGSECLLTALTFMADLQDPAMQQTDINLG
jgi:hypothetical protein